MWNRITLVVVGALMVNAASAHAQKATTLSGSDYVEIQQLYARYNHGIDSGDAKMFASAFTTDGEFVIAGGRTMKGPQAIGGMAQGPAKERAQARHITTSVVINPSPEGAKGSAYVMLVNLQATPPVITGGGVYDDVIVKAADGWRFKKRTYYPQTAPVAAALQQSPR